MKDHSENAYLVTFAELRKAHRKSSMAIREALTRAGVTGVFIQRREYFDRAAAAAAMAAFSDTASSAGQQVAALLNPPKAATPNPAAPKAAAPAAPAAPVAETAVVPSEILDLAASKARTEMAKARRLEALAGKLEGSLVPLKAVEHAAAAFVGKLRASLLGVADRVAPKLVGCRSDRAARELVRTEIEVALSMTADACEQIIEVARDV